MNLQEQISRIQSMMGVINEEQRKPSEEEFNQAMEDVKTIIPLISHRIIDEEELEHNEETMVKLNKMIRQKVKEGNDEVLDEMWELAGSRIIKNAINIITYLCSGYISFVITRSSNSLNFSLYSESGSIP